MSSPPCQRCTDLEAKKQISKENRQQGKEAALERKAAKLEEKAKKIIEILKQHNMPSPTSGKLIEELVKVK